MRRRISQRYSHKNYSYAQLQHANRTNVTATVRTAACEPKMRLTHSLSHHRRTLMYEKPFTKNIPCAPSPRFHQHPTAHCPLPIQRHADRPSTPHHMTRRTTHRAHIHCDAVTPTKSPVALQIRDRLNAKAHSECSWARTPSKSGVWQISTKGGMHPAPYVKYF